MRRIPISVARSVIGLFDFLTIESGLLRPLSLRYSNCEETSHNLKQMKEITRDGNDDNI